MEGHMAWITLTAAGLLEIVWAFFMKQSDGFTKPLPAAITVAAAIGSIVLLSLAMRTLPLGTAYAMWTGIGAVGSFMMGILVLGESASALRIAAAVLIVSGLVLMKFATAE
jgi:quaternary ammonium compound-resistance protein SugE